jgi:hypothetical protein
MRGLFSNCSIMFEDVAGHNREKSHTLLLLLLLLVLVLVLVLELVLVSVLPRMRGQQPPLTLPNPKAGNGDDCSGEELRSVPDEVPKDEDDEAETEDVGEVAVLDDVMGTPGTNGDPTDALEDVLVVVDDDDDVEVGRATLTRCIVCPSCTEQSASVSSSRKTLPE